VRAINPCDLLLDIYAKHPQAVLRQITLAAELKDMEVDELIASYSAQLAPFKTALLADLT